jgi:hypothetical protein
MQELLCPGVRKSIGKRDGVVRSPLQASFGMVLL